MVQKSVQYCYIAKCLSFMVSTEEGDYYESTTVVETEKQKQKSLQEKNKVDKETRNRNQKQSTFYTAESGAYGRKSKEEGDYV